MQATIVALLLCLPCAIFCAAGETQRELISDPQFTRGFTLSETTPGRHVQYGEITGFTTSAPPAWHLLQWSSRFPLAPAETLRTASHYACSNAAKGIVVNKSGTIAMFVNSHAEYGLNARKAGTPWVHLLVEQEFESSPPITQITSATLHVQARLLRSHNLHRGDYSPGTHAAQFQIFFTVQNRNQSSPGHGDLLWFGVPLYDNRQRFPAAYKARDFGGTDKFIFTPAGSTFTDTSAHDGKWITIEKDLLPLMREGLSAAWSAGFLKGSTNSADYAISGMNMGWELPGAFDVAFEVRGLSLKVQPGP